MNVFTKQKHSQTENKFIVTKGGRYIRMLGLADTIYKITNKDLLHSTRNSTQYSVITYMRKESKKE